MAPVLVTQHAIERFQKRVAPISTTEAARRLSEAAGHARVRATPRRWTPVVPGPGLLFLYPASLPGVCLLVRAGTVITVLERSHCRRWTAGRTPGGRRNGRTGAYERPCPGKPFEEAA